MPKGRPKKDKFADLDGVFKDEVANMSTEDIRFKISEVALNQEAMNRAMEDDQDLQEKKEQYSLASEPYREAKKRTQLSIQWCRQVLSDKGALEQ
jgi:hypothetical protein